LLVGQPLQQPISDVASRGSPAYRRNLARRGLPCMPQSQAAHASAIASPSPRQVLIAGRLRAADALRTDPPCFRSWRRRPLVVELRAWSRLNSTNAARTHPAHQSHAPTSLRLHPKPCSSRMTCTTGSPVWQCANQQAHVCARAAWPGCSKSPRPPHRCATALRLLRQPLVVAPALPSASCAHIRSPVAASACQSTAPPTVKLDACPANRRYGDDARQSNERVTRDPALLPGSEGSSAHAAAEASEPLKARDYHALRASSASLPSPAKRATHPRRPAPGLPAPPARRRPPLGTHRNSIRSNYSPTLRCPAHRPFTQRARAPVGDRLLASLRMAAQRTLYEPEHQRQRGRLTHLPAPHRAVHRLPAFTATPL